MTKILVLCTGNACRSQMAEGFLKSFALSNEAHEAHGELEVSSAGTYPASRVHPLAVQVMKESGIDISMNRPKNVDAFTGDSFDYVITVCDDAREACPVFTGKVRERIHMPFDDPGQFVGTPEIVLPKFRRVRDEIESAFRKLYKKRLARDHSDS